MASPWSAHGSWGAGRRGCTRNAWGAWRCCCPCPNLLLLGVRVLATWCPSLQALGGRRPRGSSRARGQHTVLGSHPTGTHAWDTTPHGTQVPIGEPRTWPSTRRDPHTRHTGCPRYTRRPRRTRASWSQAWPLRRQCPRHTRGVRHPRHCPRDQGPHKGVQATQGSALDPDGPQGQRAPGLVHHTRLGPGRALAHPLAHPLAHTWVGL